MAIIGNDQRMYFDEKIEELENAYFKERENNTGIIITHPVEEAAETFINKYLSNGEINECVVAWKSGTLVRGTGNKLYKPKEMKGGYLDGYGNTIDKSELNQYLQFVDRQWDTIQNADSFRDIYKCLLQNNMGIPRYIGAVHIINLVYFKSQGKWPIYDKFAHKAAKAIYMNVYPAEVYIGPALNKKNIHDVSNLYNEYIWLLNQLFGSQSIDRKTDRALWVYGHSSREFTHK